MGKLLICAGAAELCWAVGRRSAVLRQQCAFAVRFRRRGVKIRQKAVHLRQAYLFDESKDLAEITVNPTLKKRHPGVFTRCNIDS